MSRMQVGRQSKVQASAVGSPIDCIGFIITRLFIVCYSGFYCLRYLFILSCVQAVFVLNL